MTESSAAIDAGRKSERNGFFGHPKGLAYLFATELWERFSYYGMRALLVLYLVKHLLQPEQVEKVIGLRHLIHGLETLSGPLGSQALASQIYGLYTGLVYLTPILGGVLADRWLGRGSTVIVGGVLMMAGHFLMASEALFLVAIVLLLLGVGAFKPNIATQVGDLYGPGDGRRDRAYSIFYLGINIGAFFSPLVCGTLGENWGWRFGFASAGVGMAIGLATYLAGRSSLPSQAPHRNQAPTETRGDLQRSLRAVMLLFWPSALFWTAYEQQGNTMALWAEGFTDRTIDVFEWRVEIPTTWFQAFNPLMIFLFTPMLTAVWARLARSGREPETTGKLMLGCFLLAAGYGVMALGAWVNDGNRASWLWLVLYFVVLTIAELHFAPISLSLISRLAPERSRSMVMGAWMTAIFFGSLFSGWIGSLWSQFTNASFFLLIGSNAALAGVLIFALRGRLRAACSMEGDRPR